MRRLVAEGSDGYRIAKRYLHSDGHEVGVSVSVSCVRDEDGRPSYLIGQVEDATEHRARRERSPGQHLDPRARLRRRPRRC
jgi:PAS domain S-box-containing protein